MKGNGFRPGVVADENTKAGVTIEHSRFGAGNKRTDHKVHNFPLRVFWGGCGLWSGSLEAFTSQNAIEWLGLYDLMWDNILWLSFVKSTVISDQLNWFRLNYDNFDIR